MMIHALGAARSALCLTLLIMLVGGAGRLSQAPSGATVVDINRYGQGSDLRQLTAFDGKLFFLRFDAGITLWRSDGTAEGTVPVKALGLSGQGRLTGASLTVAGLRLMIVLDFADQNGGVWSSDGTSEGTRFVMSTAALEFWYRSVAAAGDRFFFTHPASNGDELWVSDGTAAGTGRVKDLRLSFPDHPQPRLTAVGDELYFVADDGVRGPAVWRSDGTEAGTRLVDADAPGAVPANPFGLGAVGGRFYFTTWDVWGNSSFTLWRTDGTAATTELVLDIPASWYFATGMAWDARLVFVFSDIYNSSAQIWVSDGTAAGTELLAAPPGAAALTVVGDRLFFQSSAALWVSDGTAAGTHPVLDQRPVRMTAVGDQLLFNVLIDTPGSFIWDAGVWMSDGTAAGTREIYHYRTARYDPWPPDLTDVVGAVSVGGVAYFPWIEAPFGTEIWRSDGTTEGTRLVQDVTPSTLSSYPRALIGLGDLVIFNAADVDTGREPWVSDGSAEGTRLLADLAPGLASSYAGYGIRLNGRVLFSIAVGAAEELWTTDGTPEGTRRLLNGLRVNALAMALSGGRLLFSGSSQGDDYELWATDGTAAGTARVRDIVPGPTGSDPSYLTDAGGTLFFLVGERLWKSDGTAAGTVQVSDQRIFRSPFSSRRAAIGRTLFFVNFDQTHGHEIWVSDGTAAGTRLVRDVLFDGMSSPSVKGVFAGKVFFADTYQCDLWVSDGTAEGTRLFKDFALQPGGPHSEFGECAIDLEHVGGRLFIAASDQRTDVELWASDGTPEGTYRVRDIRPGAAGSNPKHLAAINDMLVFSADDGVNGRALWRSDGTAAGTVLIVRVDPSPWNSAADEIIAVGDRLFFVGTDPRYGSELWSIPLGEVGLELRRVYLPLATR